MANCVKIPGAGVYPDWERPILNTISDFPAITGATSIGSHLNSQIFENATQSKI